MDCMRYWISVYAVWAAFGYWTGSPLCAFYGGALAVMVFSD